MAMSKAHKFEEGDYVTGFDCCISVNGFIRYACSAFYHIDRDDKREGSGIWYNGNRLWTIRKDDDALQLVGEETVSKIFNAPFDKIAKDVLDEYEKEKAVRKTTLPTDSAGRKEVPLYRGLVQYFPAALAGVAKVSKRGNDKHQAGKPLQHSRNKSGDHPDCILRHLIDLTEDHGRGLGRDEDGVPQVLYIAWRSLALAQQWLEENEGAPIAPAATCYEENKVDKGE